MFRIFEKSAGKPAKWCVDVSQAKGGLDEAIQSGEYEVVADLCGPCWIWRRGCAGVARPERKKGHALAQIILAAGGTVPASRAYPSADPGADQEEHKVAAAKELFKARKQLDPGKPHDWKLIQTIDKLGRVETAFYFGPREGATYYIVTTSPTEIRATTQLGGMPGRPETAWHQEEKTKLQLIPKGAKYNPATGAVVIVVAVRGRGVAVGLPAPKLVVDECSFSMVKVTDEDTVPSLPRMPAMSRNGLELGKDSCEQGLTVRFDTGKSLTAAVERARRAAVVDSYLPSLKGELQWFPNAASVGLPHGYGFALPVLLYIDPEPDPNEIK